MSTRLVQWLSGMLVTVGNGLQGMIPPAMSERSLLSSDRLWKACTVRSVLHCRIISLQCNHIGVPLLRCQWLRHCLHPSIHPSLPHFPPVVFPMLSPFPNHDRLHQLRYPPSTSPSLTVACLVAGFHCSRTCSRTHHPPVKVTRPSTLHLSFHSCLAQHTSTRLATDKMPSKESSQLALHLLVRHASIYRPRADLPTCQPTAHLQTRRPYAATATSSHLAQNLLSVRLRNAAGSHHLPFLHPAQEHRSRAGTPTDTDTDTDTDTSGTQTPPCSTLWPSSLPLERPPGAKRRSSGSPRAEPFTPRAGPHMVDGHGRDASHRSGSLRPPVDEAPDLGGLVGGGARELHGRSREGCQRLRLGAELGVQQLGEPARTFGSAVQGAARAR